MARISNRFAWPYQRPIETPFGHLSQWFTAYGRQSPKPLVNELPGWDAGSRCTCTRKIMVNALDIINGCGLDPEVTMLQVAVTVETANGRLRQVAWQNIFAADAVDSVLIRLEFGAPDGTGLLGPGALSGDLTLRTGVYLHSTAGSADPLVAVRPGSVLWSDVSKIDLDGPGTAVPMMAISFKRTFMGIDAPAADFYISLEAVRDTKSPFDSTVMVYANTDTAFEQRLANADADAMFVVYRALVTQLCMHLLLNDMLSDTEEPSEQGTVGSVAEAVLSMAFPGRTMASIAQLIHGRPAEFMVRMEDFAVRATKGLFS